MLLGSTTLAQAVPVTDFSGQTVQLDVGAVGDGDNGFFISLASSGSAVIGDGEEFSLNIGASGFATRTVTVDFDATGLATFSTASQFAIGNTSFLPFFFDLEITLPDVAVTAATSGGDLVRGDTSVAGLDPIVWTFVNELDNAFGRVMTIGPVGGVVPTLQISADPVALPAALPLFAPAALALLSLARRRSA